MGELVSKEALSEDTVTSVSPAVATSRISVGGASAEIGRVRSRNPLEITFTKQPFAGETEKVTAPLASVVLTCSSPLQ